MGQRFSDIRRSAKLAKQLQGYIDYLSNPRSFTGAYKAREARTRAVVRPYGGGLPTGISVLTSFENKPGNTALVTAVSAVAGAEISITIPATAQSLTGFRPARVTRVTAATKTVTETPSKYTNVVYRKYNTDRASVPFGAKADTDEYLDVIKTMKSALNVTGQAICWISFSPESLRFR